MYIFNIHNIIYKNIQLKSNPLDNILALYGIAAPVTFYYENFQI